MIDINTLTKIFNTGFTRETPNPTNITEISWNSFGSTSNIVTSDKNNMISTTSINSDYVNVLEKMLTSRAEYYKTIDAVAHTDKTLEIVDQLIDEILNAVNAQEPFTPAILESEPNAEKALEACKELNFECDVYRYDRDLLKHLIIYGEYFLSTSVKPGKGITEINDLVESKNILPLYKGYKLKEFIGFIKDFDNSESYITTSWDDNKIRIDRNLMTHFAVSPNRYALKDEKLKELVNKGYSTLVGVSALYPTLSRLYKLNQLDTAADIQALNQIAKPQLIGVPVGSNVKPTDYAEITRTYTNFLQPILGNNQNVDSNNILSALKNTGGFQVLPYPQGQGKPEAISFPVQDISALTSRIDKLNESIDKALGLEGSSENNRSQIYAIKSRLVKRLQDIMIARKFGWREIYLRHLQFKNIYINPINFDVQMAALPDYDIFAEAEGISHLIEAMRDAFGFAQEASTMGLVKSVDGQCLVNLFDSYVGTRYPVLKGLLGNGINTIEESEDENSEEHDDESFSAYGGSRYEEPELQESPELEEAESPEIEETPEEE